MIVTGRTRVFALLGDPVRHSLSPRMQNAAFAVLGLEAVYVALPCASGDVPGLMRSLAAGGGGGNVTVPHKVVAATATDRMEGPLPEACNVFWGEDGDLVGDNTDVTGILDGLRTIEAPATAWAILGSGGSARAALAAARERGARVLVRSRDPARAAALQEQAAGMGLTAAEPRECEVAINATPLGLAPGDPLPLEPGALSGIRCALDLVYGARETAWVHAMRAAGVRAADGREVLLSQGAASLTRWFPDARPPLDVMRAAVRAALG